MLKIRRILISVWDKKGVLELARKLAAFRTEIISTGKTAELLRRDKIPVQEVASVTNFPEILSGRVKTLHPKIFGGILANKRHPLHMEEIKNLNIQPIDMVVVNLYPFSEKLTENLGIDEMIEYIDIGGCSLIRAAAKNFKNVCCVSSPQQYRKIIEELDKTNGFLSEDTLKVFAQEAFYVTKEYDNAVYNYFKGEEVASWNLVKTTPLRYGENPHQGASLNHLIGTEQLKFKQIQGKELSFNNFLDLDTAVAMTNEFHDPAAVIIKHASICGVGVDKKIVKAFRKAQLSDPLSSFGGIISLNRKVDKQTANEILKSGFKECVIAPTYCQEALKLFLTKKNLRVIEADCLQRLDFKDIRTTLFGYLIQDRDILTIDKNNLKVVTRKKPSAKQLKDLLFAWKIAKYVKSNAIVLAKNQCFIAAGGGQPSRVGSVDIALRKAGHLSLGAVLASDGFFPKEDSIKIAYKKGIRAIIQPGGSIKDNDIIKLCNKLGISMIFTGIRHFRH